VLLWIKVATLHSHAGQVSLQWSNQTLRMRSWTRFAHSLAIVAGACAQSFAAFLADRGTSLHLISWKVLPAQAPSGSSYLTPLRVCSNPGLSCLTVLGEIEHFSLSQ